MIGYDFLLAICAIEEIEDNSWARPSKFNSFKYTCDVENVTTTNLYTRSLIVAFRVANCAVVIACLSSCGSFIFLHTLRV